MKKSLRNGDINEKLKTIIFRATNTSSVHAAMNKISSNVGLLFRCRPRSGLQRRRCDCSCLDLQAVHQRLSLPGLHGRDELEEAPQGLALRLLGRQVLQGVEHPRALDRPVLAHTTDSVHQPWPDEPDGRDQRDGDLRLPPGEGDLGRIETDLVRVWLRVLEIRLAARDRGPAPGEMVRRAQRT